MDLGGKLTHTLTCLWCRRLQALEAGGRSCGKNCVPSLACLFICRSAALRPRALRPQLKRDPLGAHATHERAFYTPFSRLGSPSCLFRLQVRTPLCRSEFPSRTSRHDNSPASAPCDRGGTTPRFRNILRICVAAPS